jgi:energy-coupling factor transporter ATP-binding protein EcfA2
MKCTRILFEGYKRFSKAECNVSPRLLAFVGPNEAGKTSILTGLEWLTEDEDEEGLTPLDPLDKCRDHKKDSGWVVGAFFQLTQTERNLLEPLGFETVPKTLGLWKQVDGTLHISFSDPKDLRREPRAFTAAIEALKAAAQRLAKPLAARFQDPDNNPSTWFDHVLRLLEDRERQWTEEEETVASQLVDWLSAAPPSASRPRAARAARLIAEATKTARQPHPKDAGRDLLEPLCPKFVLYGRDDRDLPTVSPIASPQSRAQLPPAIRNIVGIAQINLVRLWSAYETHDSGQVRTALEEANGRLQAFFEQAWNQARVSVSLDLGQHGLLTHVLDLNTRRFTRMEERSEGLRAFVAMAAFLEAQNLDVPPILLLDEADAHLHLNAQADLVGLLLKQNKASQILYTTHSPGCLPSDLGTGIRLVERSDKTSIIQSHFWSNTAPGFGSLLYAMGANAAAFSTCRRAVLAEGPSDMIMLPTLMRLATQQDELDYQVAPGLSNARAFNIETEEIAARMVYLTDGDSEGKRYRRELRQAGVTSDRIFSLPDGMGTEDLLNPTFYLDAVFALIPNAPKRPTPTDVGNEKPISLALNHWANRQRPVVKLPGKVAIAYSVIESEEIRLTARGRRTLADLHQKFQHSLSPVIDTLDSATPF